MCAPHPPEGHRRHGGEHEIRRVHVPDRGPFGNAIIDLDEEQFVELAPVGAGVINVRITW